MSYPRDYEWEYFETNEDRLREENPREDAEDRKETARKVARNRSTAKLGRSRRA